MASRIPPNHHSQRPQEKSFSLLKRNELLIIFIAALLVTVVVFFVFFRSPVSSQGKNGKTTSPTGQLEEKIKALESKIQDLGKTHPITTKQPAVSNGDITEIQQKMARMESGFVLKVDALLHKIDLLEARVQQLEQQIKTMSASPGPAPAVPVANGAEKAKPKKPAKPQPVAKKKISGQSAPKDSKKPVSKKPAVQKHKKQKSFFHAVKKGETLWSISQKHKTTVEKLRQLNHLTKESKIYPGINILIR